MDIYNSYDVMVVNCTFESNGPVVITKYFDWRGHAGGLSVAFNFITALNRSTLTTVIRDSTFRNNSVRAAVSGRQTTSQLLRRFIPTGRGGGCAINVNSLTSVHVEVSGCVFEKNFALTYGGGLYLAWDIASSHRTMLNDTTFIENESPGGAGGLEMGFARGGTEAVGNQVYASNLRFVGNTATYGGGVYVFIACEFGDLLLLLRVLWSVSQLLLRKSKQNFFAANFLIMCIVQWTPSNLATLGTNYSVLIRGAA